MNNNYLKNRFRFFSSLTSALLLLTCLGNASAQNGSKNVGVALPTNALWASNTPASVSDIQNENKAGGQLAVVTRPNMNYTSFSQPVRNSSEEVKLYNKNAAQHPELGINFTGTPCDNCYELIDKRTETQKYFVKEGSDARNFILLSSPYPMHYKDAEGRWITVKDNLQKDALNTGNYYTKGRLTDVTINTKAGYTLLTTKDGHTLKYNSDLELVHIRPDGTEQSLGKANWADHTAGDNGVYVKNAWPGIDIEMSILAANFKTGFKILSAMPAYATGKLVIRDHMQPGTMMHLDAPKNAFNGTIDIKDRDGKTVLSIGKAFAYEENAKEPGETQLAYRTHEGNIVDIEIPGTLLNKGASAYPLIIDPLATGLLSSGFDYTAAFPPAAGSFCNNVNNTSIPGGATITDVKVTFSFYGPAGVSWGQAQFSVAINGGLCPSAWVNCNPAITSSGIPGGTCGYVPGSSFFAGFSACVPPFNCNPYTLPFELRAAQRQTATGTCSQTVYATATGFYVVVEGTTTILPTITPSAPATLCMPSTLTLTGSPSSAAWSSSAPGVATVSGGVVTGSSNGTTNIILTSGSCSVSVPITVGTTPTVTGTPSICFPGSSLLTGTPGGGTWTSSLPGVATVTGGLVNAVSVGTTIINYNTGTCSRNVPFDVNSPTAVAPASQPTGITFPATTTSGATINFTPNGSTGYLVVASTSPTLSASPVLYTTYATGSAFGGGIVLQGSTSGSTPSYTTTLLNSNTLYYVFVFAFNNNCVGPQYCALAPLTGSFNTCVLPPSSLATNSPGANTISLSWTGSPAGGGYITPINYNVYAYLDAACTILAAGYPVMAGTGTTFIAGGLMTGTQYWFKVAPADACNAMSNVATDATVCTATGTLPYLQTFEIGTLVGDDNPNCMTSNVQNCVLTGVGTNTTFLGTINTNHTPGGTKFYNTLRANACSAGWANQWLLLPRLTLQAGTTYNLSVWYRTDGFAWNSLTFQYSTVGTLPPVTSTVMGGTPGNIGAGVASFSNTAWTQYLQSFTVPTSGDYYIGIDMASTVGSQIALDDIEVCAVPTVTATNSAPPYCAPANVFLSSTGTSTAMTYAWSGPSGYTSTLASPTSITGLVPGTYSYTLTAVNDPISLGFGGYCTSTGSTTFTVNAPPLPITGVTSVCATATTALSSVTPGGTWSSSNTAVGTVNTTGVVTGIAAGTTTISYIVGGCHTTTIVTVTSFPTPITGTPLICLGSGSTTTTLSSTPGGGTWTSSNTAVGTVNTTGVVQSVGSTGTTTITYTFGGSCYSTATITVTNNPAPISGQFSICLGTVVTLTSTPGVFWSASPTSGVVSIHPITGAVTGTGIGTATITANSGGCTVTQVVTVVPAPASISGPANICIGFPSSTYSNPSAGGTWSASNGNLTIVSTTGVATGVTAGSVVISYILSPTCYATYTVNVLPVAPPPTGTLSMCVGGTTTLSHATGGGLWSSACPTISTVTAGGGLVTGIGAGTCIVTYTLPGSGCIATATITVNSNPPAIGGVLAVCQGATTTLTNTAPLGTWSSSNTAIGTIGSTTGIAGGISATPAPGTATITYRLPTGCFSTATLTVSPTPVLAVTSPTVCVGATTTVTAACVCAVASSNTLVATVSGSGVVLGSSPGTTTISYTNTTGCFATTIITVIANPGAITGTMGICVGSCTTLNASPVGGTWSSSASGTAPVTTSGVTAGTPYGVVCGSAVGNANISYTVAGCWSTAQVTVNTLPSTPAGPTSVCINSTVTLTATPTGGTWSSPSGNVSVNTTTGGITGILAGTANITYSLGSSGCFSVRAITVNALPSVITASSSSVCVGSNATLTSAPAPGTWASINPAMGTINTTGVFTGVGTALPPGGSDTVSVTYSLPTGCARSFVMTVNALPSAITGATVVCEGACTPLTASPGTGTWSTSNTAVGTINSTGNYCGVANGTNTVTYTLPSGCYRTRTMAVDPIPTGVSPASPEVCVSSCITISGLPSGGTWSSGTPAVATVTSSGSLCGIAPGTVSLVYTLPTGCSRTFTATVNALPSAITGTLGVCVGATTTLSSTPATGTWSSLSTNVSVTSGTGEVTGLPPGGGTATITYTLPTGCRTTAIATVYALPATITATPSFGVCVGRTTTLNSTAGGTWSSSDPAIGSISASGVVTGVASTGADVITITNTNSNNCVRSATVTVYALPAAIGGSSAVCVGSCTTLNSTPTGGIWTSSNSAIGSIGSTSGVFCGLSGPLTVNVTYTLPSGCFITRTQTVLPLPTAPTAPSLQVCAGSSITLSGASGSSWTSSDPSVATVDASGVVTGNPGVLTTSTAIITSSLGTGCAASVTVTVQPIPTAITGSLEICETYGTTTLTGAPTGGTWSSSNTSVATIGSTSGIAMAGTFGTSIITYRLTTTGCYRMAVLTVNQLPSAFTGPSTVCVNETVTLNSTPTGGTWSSPSISVAVNPTTGEITGIASGGGTATISYANGTTGCVRTGIMTVNALPNAITGIDQVCVGLTTTLNSTSAGGIWQSSNPAIGSIDAAGVVTGITPGTTLVSYTFFSTGCRVTKTVTVNQLPSAILGPDGFCNFTTATYSSLPGSGTWSSSNTGVADFTTSTIGDATSTMVGSATITYTLPTGCKTTKDIFTIFAPYPITGRTDVCLGDTIMIGDTIGGGSWSFTPPVGVITLTPNTPTTAIVNGVGAGTVNVTYTLSTGCYSTEQLTVNPIPNAITGVFQVCEGLTTDLDNLTTGGTWASSDGTIATVGTLDGIVTGIDGGATGRTVTITYALSTGCNALQTLTVNPLPDPITGTFQVCEGLTTTLTSAPTTGTWSSADLAVATVGSSTGIVTGVNAYAIGTGGIGQTTITYTLPTGCLQAQNLTVNPLPAAISGVSNICKGDMTVLGNPTPGGSWSSSDPAIASINSFGIVTGNNAGTVVMTYMLSTGCISTWPMTVNANPDTITGSLQVCAGFATNLTSGPSGGVWSQDPASMVFGTINPITGVVSGITAGLVPVSYTLGSGCRVVATVTVVNLPAAITGDARVCEAGGTTLLTHFTTGGIWSSSNPAMATVDPVSGLVTGIAAGTSTITYTVGTGCFNIRHVTVNPLPATITGPYEVCEQSQITLANATPGGTWQSGATAIASINSGTGVLTGEAAGIAPVSYILTATGCLRSVNITVNPTPAPITGNPHICVGSAVNYASATPGGTWINSNPGVIAFVAPSPSPANVTVLPVTLGTAIITYQFGTGCRATKQVTVQPLPIVFNVTGGGSYCAGGPGVAVGVDSSQPGVSYELRRGTIAAGYISGTGFPISFGLQAAAGVYTVQATNVTSGCQRNMAGSATVIVNASVTPTVTINASPTDQVCPGETVTLNAMPTAGGTAPTYVWKVNGVTVGTGSSYSFIPSDGDIASVTMTSNGTCITTTTANMSRPLTVLPTALPVAGIIVSPNDSVCQHTPVTLTAAPEFGGTAPAYSWTLNGAPVSAASSYTYIPNNGDILNYRLTSNYRCRLVNTVMSADVNMYVEPMLIPRVDVHADPGLTVAAGKPVTLTAVAWDAGASPTYQWKVNGVPVAGATNSTYTAIFNNYDSIACMVVSSGICNNIGTSDWVFITTTTSTAQLAGTHNAITLHPNPNKGQFTVRGTLAGNSNEEATMEITNMLGQVVYKGTLQVKRGKVDAQVIMDKSLANGMYLLTLHTRDGPQTFHFVMEQ